MKVKRGGTNLSHLFSPSWRRKCITCLPPTNRQQKNKPNELQSFSSWSRLWQWAHSKHKSVCPINECQALFCWLVTDLKMQVKKVPMEKVPLRAPLQTLLLWTPSEGRKMTRWWGEIPAAKDSSPSLLGKLNSKKSLVPILCSKGYVLLQQHIL